jgi:hypothetical protein
VDSRARRPGDGRRQAGPMVEVAPGDARRRADLGTVAAVHLWERHRARRCASSVDEWGSDDGDGGAPVTATVVLR